MAVPTNDKIYTHIQLSWSKGFHVQVFFLCVCVRRVEKKIKRKERKENSVRTQKEFLGRIKRSSAQSSFRKMKNWFSRGGFSRARCLYWWPQAHVSPGCLATFLPVWMDGCPPTNQTFSLWELSELSGQANFTQNTPFHNYIFFGNFLFLLFNSFIHEYINFYFNNFSPPFITFLPTSCRPSSEPPSCAFF